MTGFKNTGLLILMLFQLVWVLPGECQEALPMDDTMLIFVGEDLEIMTIASGRKESAWDAPAVTDVIVADGLARPGVRTLADVLETVPGFYVEKKESVPEIYLRGVPGSVLFLYDAVPYGASTTRSSPLIDRELSLASVKRVEIIRGPGSVLWGPDAFAGIVNVVPMTGQDFQGVEVGAAASAPDETASTYFRAGQDWGNSTGFFSFSAEKGRIDDTPADVVVFFGDGTKPVSPDIRYGESFPDDSYFLDASGVFEAGDWLTITARLTDSKRYYTVVEEEVGHAWIESVSLPSEMLKITTKHVLDDQSEIRFKGYMTHTDTADTIIDMELKETESELFGELVYERSFFANHGLFTAGLSYREEDVEDVPVWKGYFPYFLSDKNESALPLLDFSDYETEVKSVFTQYSHTLGKFNAYAGLRYDDYNLYDDTFSYNVGGVWKPFDKWIFKALYGTAYRTPLASQEDLFSQDNYDLDPELVKSINLQAGYRPDRDTYLIVTLFRNAIENHVVEDSYAGAGFATPNDQKIMGIELEAGIRLFRNITLESSLTFQDNSGSNEIYLYYVGNIDGQDYYIEQDYEYNAGPDTLFDLTATWTPREDILVTATLSYTSGTKLYYVPDDIHEYLDGYWLVNAGVTFRDCFTKGFDIELYADNLFDESYYVSGTYSRICGDPFTAGVKFRWRW